MTYVLGTAGAGKSALTAVFSDWLQDHNIAAATVNLDPGVTWLPYSPDVDVRDYVSYENVMKEYNLGPNGALVACTDMLVSRAGEINEAIKDLDTTHIIVDTPGQLELFAFRRTGTYLASSLGEGKSAILFLLDSNLVRQPSSAVSSLLLSSSVQYRFWKPQLNVLTKSDLLSQEDLKRVETWFEEPTSLSKDLESESSMPDDLLVERILAVLEDLEQFSSIIFTSANTNFGIDTLHAELQRIYAGGENE